LTLAVEEEKNNVSCCMSKDYKGLEGTGIK
jgi:hypothetical protein